MLQEFFATLLQTVIIAAVPIITTFTVKYLNVKATQAVNLTANKKTQMYITEFTEAISTAVAYTSQTYVDTLKESDMFTEENQRSALCIARDKAITLMSKSTVDFLKELYGDAGEYIEAKIEQEIRLQKGDCLLTLASAIDIEE